MGKQKKKEKGEYNGGKVDFGFTIEEKNGKKMLVIDEQQQKLIGVMKRQRKTGKSYRAISKLIQEKYDVKLSHQGVKNIIS